jgi:hypothetical protein
MHAGNLGSNVIETGGQPISLPRIKTTSQSLLLLHEVLTLLAKRVLSHLKGTTGGKSAIPMLSPPLQHLLLSSVLLATLWPPLQ